MRQVTARHVARVRHPQRGIGSRAPETGVVLGPEERLLVERERDLAAPEHLALICTYVRTKVAWGSWLKNLKCATGATCLSDRPRERRAVESRLCTELTL